MASLKKKIIIGLIVIAVVLFLICLYLLYTTGWGDFTIENFATTNPLEGKNIKIRHPTMKNSNGQLAYWTHETATNKIRLNTNYIPLNIQLKSNDFTLSNSTYKVTNSSTNNNVVMSFNNANAAIRHWSWYLYGDPLVPISFKYSGYEMAFSYNFVKLKNGTYFIYGINGSDSKPYFVGYDKAGDHLRLLEPWESNTILSIVSWIVEFIDDNGNKVDDPIPIYTPVKQNNFLKDVAAIKITSSSTQYLTLAGLFVYDDFGNYIDLKDPKNGYNFNVNPSIPSELIVDSKINSSLTDTRYLNPVQSKTFYDSLYFQITKQFINPRYAKNILELANYIPSNINLSPVNNSNISTNTYRTLLDATNSNILAYNRPDRYNGLIYPNGLFSNGTFGFYSDTNPQNQAQYNGIWYYRFADRTDFMNPDYNKTFNISGVEIFTWNTSRSNNAKIEFIDKYNNVIATGNFDTLTENRRVFVVKNYPKIQGATDTIIKQVAYDAVYMDSSEYNRGTNINIPSIFPAPIPTYSPTNVNYGFEQNKKTPDGEVYASGQYTDGTTTYWASNVWYDSKSDWKVDKTIVSMNKSINSPTPQTTQYVFISPTSTTSTILSNDSYLHYTEYRFSNEQGIILKSYSIITSHDLTIGNNKYQTPIIWDLLGSNDGINYRLIDSQDRTASALALTANNFTLTIDKPSAYPNKTFPNNLDINDRTNINKYKFKYFRLAIKSLYLPSALTGNKYNTINTTGMLSLGGIRLYAYAEEDFPNPLGPPTTTLPTTTLPITTTTTTLPATTTTSTVPAFLQPQFEQPQFQQPQMEEPTTTMQQQMVQQQMQMEPTTTQYVELPSLTSTSTQFIPITTEYIPTTQYMTTTTTEYVPTTQYMTTTTEYVPTKPKEVVSDTNINPNIANLNLVNRFIEEVKKEIP